jgi:hypothetical protein
MVIPIREEVPPFSIVDELKKSELSMSIAQLLSVAPDIRKDLTKAIAPRRRERTMALASNDTAETTSLSATVKVEGTAVTALIDTGAAISAVSHEFLKSQGFEITRPARYKIRGISGQKVVPLGEVDMFPVTFGKVTVPGRFAVIDSSAYKIILGTDWLSKVNAHIVFRDEEPHIQITWLGRTQITPTKAIEKKEPFIFEELEDEEIIEEEEDIVVMTMQKVDPTKWIDLGTAFPGLGYGYDETIPPTEECPYCEKTARRNHIHYFIENNQVNRNKLKKKKQSKINWQDWQDLGMWKPNRQVDHVQQIITGEYCQWCHYRAEEHHCHHLVKKHADVPDINSLKPSP